MTLAEAVVYFFLLGLLLGSLYLVLIAGMRYFQYARAYTGTQQEAMKAMERLVRDLSNTEPAHITNDPTSLWFLSPERPAPGSGYAYDPATARLRWWKWVGWFLDDEQLVRSEVALTGAPVVTLEPAPGPVPTLAAFQAAVLPRRAVVARQIESLTLTGNGARTNYTITLVARDSVASDRATRVTLTSAVTVRNR